MDTSSTFAVFGDSATTMLSVLIFLATGTLAFAVMLGVRAREAVRRRAARVNLDDDTRGNGRRSLRYSGVRAAQKLVDLHDQALFVGRQQGRESAARAA